MTKEEAFKTLKENLCSMCAYGSKSMETCDIRGCDNRDVIKTLEQPETVTEFADRCRECGKQRRCKNCRWWKDSDGIYRRGIGAESICPINSKKVFDGDGYCYMFEQESEEEDK